MDSTPYRGPNEPVGATLMAPAVASHPGRQCFPVQSIDGLPPAGGICAQPGGEVMGLLQYLKALFGAAPPPPAPRRLDGRSATLLTASLKMLPEEELGWITMKEAGTLFSPEGDVYAFGEMDEAGKANLAAFAALSGRVQFEFMPVESRLYFLRKASR
jgi:hypothetical protein